MTPRVIVLFDIDSTLIRIPTNRAILATALDVATGVPGLLDRLDFQGRTDRWMAAEIARVSGLPLTGMFERFAAAYTPTLVAALAGLPSTELPGAVALLHALAAHDHLTLGLATGNLRRNAPIKLASAGLSGFFEPLRGGFGDDHEARADLVRAGARECGTAPGDRVVVVGDTHHDVQAALAAGAIAIGVATGHIGADALAAAGAAAVLPDLADRDAALEAILEARPRAGQDAGRRGS